MESNLKNVVTTKKSEKNKNEIINEILDLKTLLTKAIKKNEDLLCEIKIILTKKY